MEDDRRYIGEGTTKLGTELAQEKATDHYQAETRINGLLIRRTGPQGLCGSNEYGCGVEIGSMIYLFQDFGAAVRYANNHREEHF